MDDIRVILLKGIVAVVMLVVAVLIEKSSRETLKQHVQQVLRPVFPDIQLNPSGMIVFSICGFDARIYFERPGKYDSGSTEFKVLFAAYGSSPLFELTLKEPGLFDSLDNSSGTGLLKRMKITAESKEVKENLLYETDLHKAVQAIYLTADNSETSLRLTSSVLTIHCDCYIYDDSTLQKLARNVVSAVEQSLKAAARAGVQLAVENPFQWAASEPVLPRCSASDASSDEALYDSLDGFSEDGGWAKASPVKHKSIVEEDMPPREDAMRELDALEPHYNELSSGPEEAPSEEAQAPSSENKLPQAQEERSREEDESRLFF